MTPLIRRIYCGVEFKPTILSELTFSGLGMGTFAKDGLVFHRFYITFVDRNTRIISGRWLGMTPDDSHIDSWKSIMSIQLPGMYCIPETTTKRFSLAGTNFIYAPSVIRAEDEILIHQKTQPYVQIR